MNQSPAATSGRPSPLPPIPAEAKRIPPDPMTLTLDGLVAEMTPIYQRLHQMNSFTSSDSVEDLEYLRICASYGGRDKDVTNTLGTKVSELNAPELFQKIWMKHFAEDGADFLESVATYGNMVNILIILWNLTDKSVALCKHVFDIHLYRDLLNYLASKELDPVNVKNQRIRRPILGLMGVLHNMVQKIAEAREPMRDSGAVRILQRFRSASDEMMSCKALILQAYVITETENEQINSDDKSFQFLLKLLKSALATNEHYAKGYGFSAIEVTSALNRLAANDKNKDRIVKSGALPCYVKLLQPNCSAAEQAMAAQGLWIFAFKCKEDILKEPGCVEALKKIVETSSEESVTSQARGALWVLEDKHQVVQGANNDELKKKSGKKGDAEKKEKPSGPHVFISYQWDSKKTIMTLRDKLKTAGYRVWVDVDNMSGSVLEAMAEAVEKAIVVIICLTQKYKESPNCRTESEYTFRLKKAILPIRLQDRYYPDGWLGALVGSRLVHDFSGQFNEVIFSNLLRDLGERGRSSGFDSEDAVSHMSVAPTMHAIPDSALTRWTKDDVKKWINENDLQHHLKKDLFKDLDGSMLLELKSLRQEAPETLCMLLKEEHFTLVDILRLNKALRKI